jgi:hypothetical protein
VSKSSKNKTYKIELAKTGEKGIAVFD